MLKHSSLATDNLPNLDPSSSLTASHATESTPQPHPNIHPSALLRAFIYVKSLTPQEQAPKGPKQLHSRTNLTKLGM